MANYGVAEAKNKFTHLLDRVQDGERVVITRHGKPVAELRPMQALSWEERKARLLEISARAAQRPPLGVTALELINLDRDGAE
jgi:prevent-host-death family protein